MSSAYGRPRLEVVDTLDGLGGGLLLPDPGVFSGGKDERGRYQSARVRAFTAGFQGSIAMLRPAISAVEKVTRPYEENVWVRAGLKAVAEAFSRLPFELWRGEPGAEGSTQLEGRNPLLTLLSSPNPIQTAAEFWTAHAVNFKHDGEVYWFLANANGDPVTVTGDPGLPGSLFISEFPSQIIQVRGELVEHKTNDRGVPIAYRFPVAGEKATIDAKTSWSPEFPAGAVIPFVDYDPYNLVRGLGDVRAIAREVDEYLQAQRYQDAALRNGGDPGAWIVFERKLSPAEFDRRQQEIDDEYNVQNHGRYKAMDAGAKVIPNPVTAKDMEYMSLLDWLRDAILAALGVPPPMVGVYKDSTYNNITTAERIMWTGPNGILSLARRTADVVTNKLIRRLRGTELRDVQAHFNTEHIEVLKRDTTPQVTAATEMVKAGVGVRMSQALAYHGVDVPDILDEDDQPFDSPAFVHTTLRPAEQVLADGDEANATQEASLNGTQIAQLVAIIEKVALGTVTKEAAIELIVVAFPVDRARATAILASVEEGSAAPAEADDDVDDNGEDESGMGESDSEDSPPSGDDMNGSPNEGTSGLALRPELLLDVDALLPGVRSRGYRPNQPIEPNAPLAESVERWLSEYERATLALWQRIAEGARAVSGVAVRAQLTQAELDILTLNQAEWDEHFAALTQGPLEDVFSDALKVAHDTWGGPILDIGDPRVTGFLASQRVQLQSVSVTTTVRVKEMLLRSFAGLDDDARLPIQQRIADMLPDLTEELRRVFGTKEQRANAIARTETGRGQNGAAYLQMRESGVTKVRWGTVTDGNERDAHAEVNGQSVEIGARFTNGLLHPHESGAPASQVVNCRCWLEAAAFASEEQA